ncbi:MAG: hypothetical protein R2772_10270 [Chitinophagales bacterium]
MKKILKLLFFFMLAFAQAQDTSILLEIPKLNTEVFGDTIVRTITAGENGASFRFIDPEYGKSFWNKDSLLLFIVESYALDSNSSAYDLAFAAADFIKNGGAEQRMFGHGIPGNCTYRYKKDFRSEFSSSFYLPRKLEEDYVKEFGRLSNSIATVLGIDFSAIMYLSEKVALAAFYNKASKKWELIDPSPSTSTFVPKQGSSLVSLDQLRAKPEILLDKASLVKAKFFNCSDSLSRFFSYQELQNNLDNLETTNITEDADTLENFDNYYKLLPGQELKWITTIDYQYVDYKKCETSFESILKLAEYADSATLVQKLYALAACYGVAKLPFLEHLTEGHGVFAAKAYLSNNLGTTNVFSTRLNQGLLESSKACMYRILLSA